MRSEIYYCFSTKFVIAFFLRDIVYNEATMIYLDNAATSFFKPKGVYEAIRYDLSHSANSGRSAHRYATDCAVKIEKTREYLLEKLGADEDYSVIFTKNCTEALNLAIFGYLKNGMTAVTTANEHNSVLRPLYELAKRGVINLVVVEQDEDGRISSTALAEKAENADLLVVGHASNVTGAIVNLAEIGEKLRHSKVKILVDGAQSVPILSPEIKSNRIDMLACPGHKGLHGMQGTGFLIVKKDASITPLIYGGTGVFSENVYQSSLIPEDYEAGTLFAGGISALLAGAKWSFDNLPSTRYNVNRLTTECVRRLNGLGAKTYVIDTAVGIVSFNFDGIDSTEVANFLSEKDIAVRSGLHCAPLVHRFLGTTEQGAVRVSFGADNTDRDLYILLSALDEFKTKRHSNALFFTK